MFSAVANNVAADHPDFLIALGDNVQVTIGHPSDPMPDASEGSYLYSRFREGLGALGPSVPLFSVIGNWDGENGWLTAPQLALARSVRKKYIPNPLPTTYPEGGSGDGDYYAWTWGNALFVVLNVMSYTLIDHSSGFAPGKADDWTLGKEQMVWLRTTLSNSGEKWKFIFIHHPVGGHGSTPVASNHGRGGGAAAYVGEQAEVQALMREDGVDVFFYGHDHCFADETVDGVHYTCTASCGAAGSFCRESGDADALDARGHTVVTVGPMR